MTKILGVDLGTNSTGWAIRNTELEFNQINKFGVITFNKGVGDSKNGEYSFAAERTTKRSIRRLYQARKYRLWATLEQLILLGYCPLSLESLNKWRHYKKSCDGDMIQGRIYPIDDPQFDSWIKMDFDGDGKPDYISPYQLRRELSEIKFDFEIKNDKLKLGRALYHISQRRGFKSSRKDPDSTNDEGETIDGISLPYSELKKNKSLSKYYEQYPAAKTVGSLFSHLEDSGVRIREDIIQFAIREDYKKEIEFIFAFQQISKTNHLYINLVESSSGKNDGSIFFRRQLRSQKGLIGKCTLEPKKSRVSVSHPAFEIFRAWSFLNNIRYNSLESLGNGFPLPLEMKKKILEDKFFRKSKAFFPFSEISKYIEDQGHKWSFNYSPNTSVAGCPVLARLKDIFGPNYLSIKVPKVNLGENQNTFYTLEDIWHILFSFEDRENLVDFARTRLNLSDQNVNKFVIAWNNFPTGYAMLSLNAINKINIFLEDGIGYTESVFLANVPTILGYEIWNENKESIKNNLQNIINETKISREVVGIVNILVSKHKNLPSNEKFGFKDNSYKLDEADLQGINKAIYEYYGRSKFDVKPEDEKLLIFNSVKSCFQGYFRILGLTRVDIDNETLFIINVGNTLYHKTDSGYFKAPKILDVFKSFLVINFNVSESACDKIYHPSDISIYPISDTETGGKRILGSPVTGSFKNPMAMRALHELRKLVNYLIRIGEIDTETRVVVEVARELSDSNKRWAIQVWQKQRESENREFSNAIEQLIAHKPTLRANKLKSEDIDKMRLWYEQSEDEEVISALSTNDKAGKDIPWLGNIKNSYREIAGQKNMVEKYRLWQEQECTCMYTGKVISLSDLFDDNLIDFEHTIPRSICLDNSLANQTVAYASFNRNIKKNLIPFNLQNYEDILGRIQKWQFKINRIKQQIEYWRFKSKKATMKEFKDDAIRQRHLWQMELEYWKNKVERFTMSEVTSGFINRQKVDTQLISKYAFHFLKSYFERVDVQKGAITAEFRKIFSLQQEDEKKDRSKHSHHAKDAAVLTLIPGSGKRDDILKDYYIHKESSRSFTLKPYKNFKREYVWGIDDIILINNVVNKQYFTLSKRVERKGGKIQYIKGTDSPKIATGDSIRGQLHLETFYGAIKPAIVDVFGSLTRNSEGHILTEDGIKFVLRVPFRYKATATGIGFHSLDEIDKKIVDRNLYSQIEMQVIEAGGLKEAFESGIFMVGQNGQRINKIRHLRCWANVSDPLKIKQQTYKSKYEYKNHYWASNAINALCAYYNNDRMDVNGKKIKDRSLEIINLFDAAKLKSIGFINNNQVQVFKKKLGIDIVDHNDEKIVPYAILKAGLKVIIYDEGIEELKIKDAEGELVNQYMKRISNRLYKIVKFSGGQVTLLHHIEARSEEDQIAAYPTNNFFKIDGKGNSLTYGMRGKNGFTEKISDAGSLNSGLPWHKLLYTKDWLNFAVEGYQFKLNIDGSISWFSGKN